jgi:putative ABC transport system permease protein
MIWHDIRYALRMFSKSPGFVAMAVLALGFGIGANSAIFSFLNAFVLRPLPSVADAHRVVMIETRRRGNIMEVSYPDFLDWRQQARAFSSMVAVESFGPIVTGAGEPERVPAARVSAGFFDLFTARPAMGRVFSPQDYAPGAPPVVAIGYKYWQRSFAGRSGVIGASVTIDGVSHKIVGILPAGFRYSWEDDDLFAPLVPDGARAPRGRRSLDVMARLKPGVSLTAAQTEMDTIARRLEIEYPATNTAVRASVEDLIRMLGDGPDQGIYMLMGVVGFVLLIACANVANLQLARAAGRQGEMAVRTALGASRARLIRLVLTESTGVALLGGVFGIALSYAGARMIVASLPAGVQPLNPDFFDARVLAFTAAVAVLTGILAGIAPALRASRIDIHSTLKEARRGAGGSAYGTGMRGAFVIAEISLAVLLLLAAGLLIRSFNALQSVDPGFRVDGLLTAQVQLPQARYPSPESRAAFFRDLLEKSAAIPGVESADACTSLPMTGGGYTTSFVVDGRPAPPSGHENSSHWRAATPGYFQTLGIPLVRGRAFNALDTAASQRVAIVNQRMARMFFPNEDPLGKRIKWSNKPNSPAPWMTIVGVSGDVKSWRLGAQPQPEMFTPLSQQPQAFLFLAIRTWSADPSPVAGALRAALRQVDPGQPITEVRSMRSIVSESLTEVKYVSRLTALFAVIAMLMAAMGIYGVIGYSVAQRTHEFGVRMVLGAGTAEVVRLVLRQALYVVAIGLVIGVAGALAVARLLASWLYGVGEHDPLTFTLVPLALGAIALLASYIPARCATRVDPAVALRCE